MKTDRKTKGKLDSSQLEENHKKQRSASNSKSSGKPAEKKRKRPLDLQFADIIEKMNEGFVALDEQMNYIYINRRGGELLQRQPEDLIGKNYWEEYPQDKDTSFGKAYLRALESQTPVEIEDYYAPRGMWFSNRIYHPRMGFQFSLMTSPSANGWKILWIERRRSSLT